MKVDNLIKKTQKAGFSTDHKYVKKKDLKKVNFNEQGYTKIINKFNEFEWNKIKDIKRGKWSISDKKAYDKLWFSYQKKMFDVLYFEYNESFDKPIFSTHLVRTWLKLKKVVAYKDLSLLITWFKKIILKLENLWFFKYRNLLNDFKKIVYRETKSPIYFFHKYYYEFLTIYRLISIMMLTDIVIPNLILMNPSKKVARGLDFSTDKYAENVVNSIDTFVEIIDSSFLSCLKKYKGEVDKKGKDFMFDKKEPDFNITDRIFLTNSVNWEIWVEKFRKSLLPEE